jgi:transcription antitermination factor NusG
MNPVPWYALYTKPRHEKKLADLLNEKHIEAYVPVRRVLKQWSDRKKMVDEPLIRSYCFVRANPGWYYEALNTPGAVRYVWFSGQAAPIPDWQIKVLRTLTGSDLDVECHTGLFQPGVMVKVIAGPLIGTVGEMISKAGKNRMLIRIDHLDSVVSVAISPFLLEKLPDRIKKIQEEEAKKKHKRFW